MSRPLCSNAECSNLARRRTGRGTYAKECDGCFRKRTGKQKSGGRQRKFRRLRQVCACEVCGYRHETPAFFDVHHIDGNHQNNEKQNLIVVCPNCHRNAHIGMVREDLGSPRWESAQQPRLFQ